MESTHSQAAPSEYDLATQSLERMMLISRRIMQFEDNEDRIWNLTNRIKVVINEIQAAVTMYNTNI